MTSSDTDKLAVCREESGTGFENTLNPHHNDSVVSELRDSEDSRCSCQNKELNTSDELKFELETLSIQRDRLKKENRRLTEMLEGIKLEEDITLLKEEVSILGEEKEQILHEIQRRKQSLVINVSNNDIPATSD